jgi:hypothetical protein
MRSSQTRSEITLRANKSILFFHSTADSLELCGRAKPATQSSQIEANTKQETKHHTKGDKQHHIGRKACLQK